MATEAYGCLDCGEVIITSLEPTRCRRSGQCYGEMVPITLDMIRGECGCLEELRRRLSRMTCKCKHVVVSATGGSDGSFVSSSEIVTCTRCDLLKLFGG